MGDHQVKASANANERLHFVKHLLDDIRALEQMLQENLIESNISRIGAEQEFCLINSNWRPSNQSEEILKAIEDPHFTTELARYNLEINLDPFELKGNCFSKVEHQLNSLLDKAEEIAAKHDVNVLLTGILPTISKNELEFDFMTPNPRYWAINDRMKEIRGSDFELRLKGVDELTIKHDSVLFEACNTSFQMHLQVSPDDFISSYNWAQAIAGPVLGICTNSPLLLGRELWSETRIALFQQSIDLRTSSYALKNQLARVTFGDDWASGSIADIFKNDIANYKVLLGKEIERSSLEELAAGGIPKLAALNLHNSTIYRWNRPCYGVGGGKPHIRIENRYIPSGPSRIDEIANFAFWVGLMKGRPKKFDDLPAVMEFKEAKLNFVKCARTGKESVLNWLGKKISVRDLILEELLPMAEEGLKRCEIDENDIERLLVIIEERTKSKTGSQWMVENYRELRKHVKQDDALLSLTRSVYENQQKNQPIHNWPVSQIEAKTHESAFQVRHIMSTQLFTVDEHDPAELATSIMKWKDIHHMPVENSSRKLCGILTWTHMKKFIKEKSSEELKVCDIMAKEVHTVEPSVLIKDAIKLMKKYEIGCLPVINENHLLGIITISDVIPFDNE